MKSSNPSRGNSSSKKQSVQSKKASAIEMKAMQSKVDEVTSKVMADVDKMALRYSRFDRFVLSLAFLRIAGRLSASNKTSFRMPKQILRDLPPAALN